jgi:hypothetical protein
MADGKIGVGATIGIVVGITAVLGLGLYFILRPKTSNVQPAYVPPPSNNAELVSLKAQLAELQKQQANSNSLSQQQKDANDAQIKGILIATGGKLLTSGIESWISGWNKSTNNKYNLDTTPVSYESDFVSRDYSTPLTLSSDLPLWARS